MKDSSSASGSFAPEASLGSRGPRDRDNRGAQPPEVVYGAVPPRRAAAVGGRAMLLARAAEAVYLSGAFERAVALAEDCLEAVDEPSEVAVGWERLPRYRWVSRDGAGAQHAHERSVAVLLDDAPYGCGCCLCTTLASCARSRCDRLRPDRLGDSRKNEPAASARWHLLLAAGLVHRRPRPERGEVVSPTGLAQGRRVSS
jgi:hypothetical protein